MRRVILMGMAIVMVVALTLPTLALAAEAAQAQTSGQTQYNIIVKQQQAFNALLDRFRERVDDSILLPVQKERLNNVIDRFDTRGNNFFGLVLRFFSPRLAR